MFNSLVFSNEHFSPDTPVAVPCSLAHVRDLTQTCTISGGTGAPGVYGFIYGSRARERNLSFAFLFQLFRPPSSPSTPLRASRFHLRESHNTRTVDTTANARFLPVHPACSEPPRRSRARFLLRFHTRAPPLRPSIPCGAAPLALHSAGRKSMLPSKPYPSHERMRAPPRQLSASQAFSCPPLPHPTPLVSAQQRTSAPGPPMQLGALPTAGHPLCARSVHVALTRAMRRPHKCVVL